MFTTIATGAAPAIHYLQQRRSARTVGAADGHQRGRHGRPQHAADQATLIQRVLAGDDSAIVGISSPALGGVDRSTVAVIPSSTLVNGTRQTMAYFGATDGMLHAVCVSVGGNCDVIGRELWAYLPRTELGLVRYNKARIDGSPRVMDVFGDFTGTGAAKRWRTVLVFQTGTGDTTLQSARAGGVRARHLRTRRRRRCCGSTR